MKLLSVLEKTFIGKPIDTEWFVYNVREVIPALEESYIFKIDVELPIKGQSYVENVFHYDINGVMSKLQKYVGRFAYSLKFYVDGEEAFDYYIRPEKLAEINEGVREKIKKVTFDNRTIKLTLDIDPYDFGRGPINVSSDTLEFYFGADITNVEYKGKEINLEPLDQETLDDMSGYLSELLADSDNIRSTMEDVLYYSLEPEIHLNDTEMYYVSTLILLKIDGVDVNNRWGGKFNFDSLI